MQRVDCVEWSNVEEEDRNGSQFPFHCFKISPRHRLVRKCQKSGGVDECVEGKKVEVDSNFHFTG